MSENAITVKNVTKVYQLYDRPIDRLKESLSPSHKSRHKDFYALNDISFEVEKGQTVTYEDVLADVNRRDYQDSHREIAPLKPSADSIMADTSDLDLQQSTDLIINIIREHTK